jgi:hypothetical protein
MQSDVGSYLEEVRAHLHLDPRTERRVINELHTHFQEKVDDLQYQGLAEEEATHAALASFGDARFIARLMYEAHSRGTWTDALISCQPHFILAALFATHIWRYPLLLAGAFAAIAIIAMMGWRNGSPDWLYSWMGYAMLPLLILSFVSMDPVAQTVGFLFSGRGTPAPLWHLAGLAVLYAFTFWLIASTAVRVARRDWILLSLMLLPRPVIAIWVLTVTQSAGFLVDALRSIETRFSQWDSAMAYFFAGLGVTTALFIRIRQRAWKVIAVIAVGIVASALALRSFWGDLGLFRLIAVTVCLFLFLTIPLLLRTMLGQDHLPKEAFPY